MHPTDRLLIWMLINKCCRAHEVDLHYPTTVAGAAPSTSTNYMLDILCLHMSSMSIKGHMVDEGQKGDAYLEDAGFVKGQWCTVRLGSLCSEDVTPSSDCNR